MVRGGKSGAYRPPDLQPPDSADSRAPIQELQPPGTIENQDRSGSGAQYWLWLALALTVILSLAVIFLLPRTVTEPTERDQAVPPSVPIPATAPESVNNKAARTNAEQTLQSLLHLQAALELANAGTWAEPEWSRSFDEADRGDRLFSQRRFREAGHHYATALQLLEQLRDSRDQRLSAALDAGQRALEDNDADTAISQFELALLIEPAHEIARRALTSARVREEVLRQMNTGKDASEDGDLEAAEAAFRKAAELDDSYEPAQRHLKQVTAELADQRFNTALNRALGALDAGRLSDAEASLDEASALQPDSQVVGNARKRLILVRQQAALAGLRGKASASTRKEDWKSASAYYRKALAIDANTAFARNGLALAQERILLHQQLDHYLEDPDRLFSAEPRNNAARLLSSAGSIPDNEPLLSRKIARLSQYLSEAQTPVQVTLRSDGETEVALYHVARLGRFHTRELELLPGTYTLSGSRPGYRDVRVVFTLKPGRSPPSPEIRCREQI